MIVLGYSGLDASVAFAREEADLRPGEERMVQGLDSAAAIVVDGEIVAAAAEERFCDEKHTNRYPLEAIRYCLGEAGVGLNEVDVIAHGFNYKRAAAFYRRFNERYYDRVLCPAAQIALWQEHFGNAFSEDRFQPVTHHLAHGASAYFPGGFDRALCVVCDGMGELESLTAYSVESGRFERLGHVSIPNSIGILYSLVTRHLGFKFNADEYKLMGLAPYGDPSSYRALFADLVDLQEDGRYELRFARLIGEEEHDPRHRSVLDHLEKEVISTPESVETMSQDHHDFAAAAQEALENALMHALSHWQAHTGHRNLCMAGGVALNCTFNGKLIERAIFDDIFIQPAAGDDGSALGAALYAAAQAGDALPERQHRQMPFYGPSYGVDAILAAAAAFADDVVVEDLGSVEAAAEDAAEGVEADLVQAWFQGRMEFGPRALGNRTILANPASPDIKSRVNQIIKLREGFRPFAPAVLSEHAAEYFDIDVDASPFQFMLGICQVREAWRSRLPGITHVDGSARVQTVTEAANPLFFDLIRRIGDRTGIYCTLNTSFNVRSQPMIVSPRIAIETFLKVRIDRLYLESVRVTKRAG